MNLYNIEQKFLQIFNEIEENEGEITEELQQQLEINENDFKDKLNNYYKIILQWKGYIEQLKAEKCRINDRKNNYENKIKSISNTIIEALEKFGTTNKSGNIFIELPEAKLFCRHTQSGELDEARINLFISATNIVMHDIFKNGDILLGKEADIEGLLNVINANAKAEWENNKIDNINEFIPFTLEDLETLKVNIHLKYNLKDWISGNESLIRECLMNDNYLGMSSDISLSNLKNAIDTYGDKITIGHLNDNKSLNIK